MWSSYLWLLYLFCFPLLHPGSINLTCSVEMFSAPYGVRLFSFLFFFAKCDFRKKKKRRLGCRVISESVCAYANAICCDHRLTSRVVAPKCARPFRGCVLFLPRCSWKMGERKAFACGGRAVFWRVMWCSSWAKLPFPTLPVAKQHLATHLPIVAAWIGYTAARSSQ